MYKENTMNISKKWIWCGFLMQKIVIIYLKKKLHNNILYRDKDVNDDKGFWFCFLFVWQK